MRTLIDGYNLMFAGGLLGKPLGPDGLRKVRHRFLNDLAARLGPLEATRTTVVFDAATAPANRPAEATHKGLTVLYSVGDENADARIEALILGHSHARDLTVVSSDRRIRQAATRRRAKAVTADEFWSALDALRNRRPEPPPEPPKTPTGPVRGRDAGDPAHWLEVFADVEDVPEAHDEAGPGSPLLTDAEIARIAREVEAEFGE